MTDTPTKRDISKIETRARIVAAATMMVREGGCAAVSARDLAKAVGLSTGAVFTHWKSLGDLMDEVMANDAPAAERQMDALRIEALRIQNLNKTAIP